MTAEIKEEEKLTSANVDRVFRDCLFSEGEDTSNHVVAEGIAVTVGFHPERLESHRELVKTFLSQLPIAFMPAASGGGDGMSFLQACMDADGVQWGEHQHMDQLFMLGMGLKLAQYCLPRRLWAAFPGGMPYIAVNLEGVESLVAHEV